VRVPGFVGGLIIGGNNAVLDDGVLFEGAGPLAFLHAGSGKRKGKREQPACRLVSGSSHTPTLMALQTEIQNADHKVLPGASIPNSPFLSDAAEFKI
jgi:hypothetical protein